MAQERLGLIWSVAFCAGSVAQLAARLSGFPAVVLLLAMGLLMGRAGVGLVDPEALGDGLDALVGLLVSLVLFEGGLSLRLAGREQQATLLRLVLVRWPLGLVGGAWAAHQLAGLSWSLAWVFGAIALATGPTVITPLVQQMRLEPALAGILEAEGLVLEPVGAVLALVMLQLALGVVDSWPDLAWLLLLRLGGGVVIGAVTGWLLALLLGWLLREGSAESHPAAGEASSPQVVLDSVAVNAVAPAADRIADGASRPAAAVEGPAPEASTAASSSPWSHAAAGVVSADPAELPLQLQLSLGVLFLMFTLCNAVLPEAGLPAAVSAGVVVSLQMKGAVEPLRALIQPLAQLAITVLFPLLAADLTLADLSPLGWGGLACVLALMPIRGVVVQVAGLGMTPLDWRRKLLLSWIAPRGIVTAAVASLFALQLDQAGVPGGSALKGLVFLTILLTVTMQGFTAPWLATRLGLVESSADAAAAAIPQV